MDVWVLKHIVDFYFNHRVEFYQIENIYQGYIGAQKDLTQVTTLKEKVWGSAAKLNQTSEIVLDVKLWICEQWQAVL